MKYKIGDIVRVKVIHDWDKICQNPGYLRQMVRMQGQEFKVTDINTFNWYRLSGGYQWLEDWLESALIENLFNGELQ